MTYDVTCFNEAGQTCYGATNTDNPQVWADMFLSWIEEGFVTIKEHTNEYP